MINVRGGEWSVQKVRVLQNFRQILTGLTVSFLTISFRLGVSIFFAKLS